MKTYQAILVGLALVMSLVMRVEAFPRDGLVVYLSFDGDTLAGDKAKDLSDEGNDGIINGGATSVAGKYAEALEFDGQDDFVEIPLTPSITFAEGDSLTVQAWVKTDDSPTQNDGIVGNYRQSTDALWVLSISGDDPALRGKMGFSVRDVGRANSAGVRSPDFLNDNEWHHLVGIRDQQNKKVRFYVDGDLIDEVDDGTKNINSGQSIWIGEHLNRFFKGVIDEVKVWSRPLDENEVKQSMAGIAPVQPAGKSTTSWGAIKGSY